MDVVFILANSRVTTRVNRELVDLGFAHDVDSIAAAEYFGIDSHEVSIRARLLNPVWVDDFAAPVLGAAKWVLRLWHVCGMDLRISVSNSTCRRGKLPVYRSCMEKVRKWPGVKCSH